MWPQNKERVLGKFLQLKKISIIYLQETKEKTKQVPRWHSSGVCTVAVTLTFLLMMILILVGQFSSVCYAQIQNYFSGSQFLLLVQNVQVHTEMQTSRQMRVHFIQVKRM